MGPTLHRHKADAEPIAKRMLDPRTRQVAAEGVQRDAGQERVDQRIKCAGIAPRTAFAAEQRARVYSKPLANN